MRPAAGGRRREDPHGRDSATCARSPSRPRGKARRAAPAAWSRFEGTVAANDARGPLPGSLTSPALHGELVGAPALAVRDTPATGRARSSGPGSRSRCPSANTTPARLINIGSNRWSFRPEIGPSRRQGRLFEIHATGAWCSRATASTRRYVTSSRTRQVLREGSTLVYNFRRRGCWPSVNYGYATGGERRRSGCAKQDIQTNNQRASPSLLPAGRAGSAKLTHTNGPWIAARCRLRLLRRRLSAHVGRARSTGAMAASINDATFVQRRIATGGTIRSWSRVKQATLDGGGSVRLKAGRRDRRERSRGDLSPWAARGVSLRRRPRDDGDRSGAPRSRASRRWIAQARRASSSPPTRSRSASPKKSSTPR